MSRIDPAKAWDWIVQCYARPGEADALLQRQQDAGLDIVFHLFERYAREALGIHLDADAVAQAHELVATWRTCVIEPLRGVRRDMKTRAGLEGIDPSRHEVRESIKGIELMAERVELLTLCRWLEDRLGQGATDRGERS